MSLAARIVGIPDLEVERVDRQKSIEVWAKPSKRPYLSTYNSRRPQYILQILHLEKLQPNSIRK